MVQGIRLKTDRIGKDIIEDGREYADRYAKKCGKCHRKEHIKRRLICLWNPFFLPEKDVVWKFKGCGKKRPGGCEHEKKRCDRQAFLPCRADNHGFAYKAQKKRERGD